MSTTRDIDLGIFHIESVRRLRITFKKDGVAWSSMSAVTLTFENPDRTTQTSQGMTLESSNVWYYDLTTTDITDDGYWTLGVTVTDSGSTIKYPYEIGFNARSQP